MSRKGHTAQVHSPRVPAGVLPVAGSRKGAAPVPVGPSCALPWDLPPCSQWHDCWVLLTSSFRDPLHGAVVSCMPLRLLASGSMSPSKVNVQLFSYIHVLIPHISRDFHGCMPSHCSAPPPEHTADLTGSVTSSTWLLDMPLSRCENPCSVVPCLPSLFLSWHNHHL